MKVTIDGAGRIVVPKGLRDVLGLDAGDSLDISAYGSGLLLDPEKPTARLIRENGRLVAASGTAITDDDVRRIIDDIRR